MSGIDINTIGEIKSFLDGYNLDLKYITNVEANPDKNYAECVIHEPNCEAVIRKIPYIPFMHMKDLEANGIKLYSQHGAIDVSKEKAESYGITIVKLETGNQKRLNDGYCYKIESSKSYNSILNYLKDGGIDVFEKKCGYDGKPIKDFNGRYIYTNRDMFSSLRTTEQFFISTKSRLFKGLEEYKDVHRLTFDIETMGLRYNIARVFAIGVRDNRGLDIILEADKLEDDEAEKKLIKDFFKVLVTVKPAVIVGQNSENFDFDFILGRAKILKLNLFEFQTTLNKEIELKRRPNVSVKYGNTSDKFTATEIWGISVIDTLHAIKRTAAVNSEIKRNDLKYIAKYENIARPNRTYIKGEGNDIYYFYQRNNIFVCDDKNNYLEIPKEFQTIAKKLHILQLNKSKLKNEEYILARNVYFGENTEFVNWLRTEALPKGMTNFINGKRLTKQYLSDDLWETSEVDELYNQSSFMLAKIVPTTYQRVCTMGTAAIWNLLLTAWSYENNVSIPYSEKKEGFSGGLARTFKTGFAKRWVKIDYASLYPMIQLTDDIFPMFDITGVIKKMLLYLTTTRNIYKKLANYDDLNENEVILLQGIDHDIYIKYLDGTITAEERAMFKVKQLPIKILNNSLFGALGSGIAFNWSDNICAARITCSGRLHLRHAINWFSKYDCLALLAVTDGINFTIPEKTILCFNDEGAYTPSEGIDIEEGWISNGKNGIAALIDKFNKEEMKPPYMSVDNDGEFLSCLNISRINYATLSLVKNKKTGEMVEKIKLTGNTIKSKTMPEYIEDFINKGFDLILHGKALEFVEYYNSYAEEIYYMQIPLKKIATKTRYKSNIKTYLNRGNDKNGKKKAKQAHMELMIQKRNDIALELYEKQKDSLVLTNAEEKLLNNSEISLDESVNEKLEKKKMDLIMKLVIDYMPPEPDIDSMIYFVNTGTKKGDGNSSTDENKRYNSTLITNQELLENPNLKGKYNAARYLGNFNKKVAALLTGFEPELVKRIISEIKLITTKIDGNKIKRYELKQYMPIPSELILKSFDLDNFEEAMHLEPKEVEFWNKTGYDPNLVWDGFKCYDDNKLHLEVYNEAFEYLNNKMVEAGKKPLKSINDKYEKGDLILIKNEFNFMLGEFNGIYIKIIKDIENLPKSSYQIELEKLEEIRKIEIEKLRILNNEDLKSTIIYDEETTKYLKHFDDFRKNFKLSDEFTFEMLINTEDGIGALNDFINNIDDIDDDFDADDGEC